MRGDGVRASSQPVAGCGLDGVEGMPVRTPLPNDRLHQAKLVHTRRRRESLGAQRELEEAASGARRNDLVPRLEVRMVPTRSLKVSRHRTRKMTPEQLKRVTHSLREFGISRPILIDGELEIIDGHIVHAAAIELGIDEVPTIACTHLSRIDVRRLRLALNRIGELGEWDMDLLKLEFEGLIELDTDLEVTGFSSADQDIILLDDEPGVEDDDEPTLPDVATSRLGDVWKLGDHRVACADATDPSTYGRLAEGGEVHAVVADFPYNVPIAGNVSGLGKIKHGEFVAGSGEMTDDQFGAFLLKTFQAITALLAPGAVFFGFMDWRSIDRLYDAGHQAGLKLINLIVWYKGSGGMGALYRSAHELIAVFCNGDRPRVNNVRLGKGGRDRTNVWEAPGANRRGSSANAMLHLHATPKPVELCLDAILDVTDRGDLVLDPFLGSGTTLIAAHRSGRRCLGVELDPKFVDVAVRRWEDESGHEAVLVGTGETYADVGRRRLGEEEEASSGVDQGDGE